MYLIYAFIVFNNNWCGEWDSNPRTLPPILTTGQKICDKPPQYRHNTFFVPAPLTWLGNPRKGFYSQPSISW